MAWRRVADSPGSSPLCPQPRCNVAVDSFLDDLDEVVVVSPSVAIHFIYLQLRTGGVFANLRIQLARALAKRDAAGVERSIHGGLHLFGAWRLGFGFRRIVLFGRNRRSHRQLCRRNRGRRSGRNGRLSANRRERRRWRVSGRRRARRKVFILGTAHRPDKEVNTDQHHQNDDAQHDIPQRCDAYGSSPHCLFPQKQQACVNMM